MNFKTKEEILFATEDENPSEIAYSRLTMGKILVHNFFSNLVLTRHLSKRIDSFLEGKLIQKSITTLGPGRLITFSQVVFYLGEPILTVEELYSDSSYEDCVDYDLQIVDKSRLKNLYEEIYQHLFEINLVATRTKISQYR